MPRYHFDLMDDDDPDVDGSILADAAAARKTAIAIALDAAAGRPPIDGRPPAVVTIRDAEGRMMRRVWVQIHELEIPGDAPGLRLGLPAPRRRRAR